MKSSTRTALSKLRHNLWLMGTFDLSQRLTISCYQQYLSLKDHFKFRLLGVHKLQGALLIPNPKLKPRRSLAAKRTHSTRNPFDYSSSNLNISHIWILMPHFLNRYNKYVFRFYCILSSAFSANSQCQRLEAQRSIDRNAMFINFTLSQKYCLVLHTLLC